MECFCEIMLSQWNRTEKYHARIYMQITCIHLETHLEMRIFMDEGEGELRIGFFFEAVLIFVKFIF